MLELAPYLAEGTRRGLLIGEASDPEGPDAPGLLVLSPELAPESMTPGVERWLSELPDGDWEGKQRLPSAVLAVARRAQRSAGGVDAQRDRDRACAVADGAAGSCSTAQRSCRSDRLVPP